MGPPWLNQRGSSKGGPEHGRREGDRDERPEHGPRPEGRGGRLDGGPQSGRPAGPPRGEPRDGRPQSESRDGGPRGEQGDRPGPTRGEGRPEGDRRPSRPEGEGRPERREASLTAETETVVESEVELVEDVEIPEANDPQPAIVAADELPEIVPGLAVPESPALPTADSADASEEAFVADSEVATPVETIATPE